MSKYDNDDPIQDVSRGGIFSKLKRFEEDDEYNLGKIKESNSNSHNNENKYNNTRNSYNTKNSYNSKSYNNFKNYYSKTKYNNYPKSSFATKFLIFCFVALIVFCRFIPIIFEGIINEQILKLEAQKVKKQMPFETSLGIGIPELEDEYDIIAVSELEYISFNKAGNIPTLYKYDKNTTANWCNFTELDDRFTFNVNTIQINYGNIPQSSIYKLTQGLLNRHYNLVNNYPTGDLYAINTSDGYFLFVLVSSNNIIYGAAQGSYQEIFNVKENN